MAVISHGVYLWRCVSAFAQYLMFTQYISDISLSQNGKNWKRNRVDVGQIDFGSISRLAHERLNLLSLYSKEPSTAIIMVFVNW